MFGIMQCITLPLSRQSEEKSVFRQWAFYACGWRCQRIHSYQIVVYSRLSDDFGEFRESCPKKIENALSFWPNPCFQIIETFRKSMQKKAVEACSQLFFPYPDGAFYSLFVSRIAEISEVRMAAVQLLQVVHGDSNEISREPSRQKTDRIRLAQTLPFAGAA